MSYPHLLPKGFTAVTKGPIALQQPPLPQQPATHQHGAPPPNIYPTHVQHMHSLHSNGSPYHTIHHPQPHHPSPPLGPHTSSQHPSHSSPNTRGGSHAHHNHRGGTSTAMGYSSHRSPVSPAPPLHAHSHASLESAVALATAAAAALGKDNRNSEHTYNATQAIHNQSSLASSPLLSSSSSHSPSFTPSPVPHSHSHHPAHSQPQNYLDHDYAPHTHDNNNNSQQQKHFPQSHPEQDPDNGSINNDDNNGGEDEAFLEAEHFIDVVYHFEMYATHTFGKYERLSSDFHSIDPALQRLLPGYDAKMQDIRSAILHNYNFIHCITQHRYVFQNDDTINYTWLEQKRLQNGYIDEEKMSKVRSTLRQCVRDWSKEGEKERHMCYTPILKELERLFPATTTAGLPMMMTSNSNTSPPPRSQIRVLVPGSGLGRLTWEIANLGFYAQGNEFSYFMLLTSFLLLNHSPEPYQYTIYPYVHDSKNVMRNEDMVRAVRIPDVEVTKLQAEGRFSMVAGDFMDVYSEEGREYRMKEKDMKERSERRDREDKWKVQQQILLQQQQQQQPEQVTRADEEKNQTMESGSRTEAASFQFTASTALSTEASSPLSQTSVSMDDANHNESSAATQPHVDRDQSHPTRHSPTHHSPSSLTESSSTSHRYHQRTQQSHQDRQHHAEDENESSEEEDDDESLGTSMDTHEPHSPGSDHNVDEHQYDTSHTQSTNTNTEIAAGTCTNSSTATPSELDALPSSSSSSVHSTSRPSSSPSHSPTDVDHDVSHSPHVNPSDTYPHQTSTTPSTANANAHPNTATNVHDLPPLDPRSTLHQRESWDAITTCYFIDCSNNILEFIRTIAFLLKPNGYWINFGPLLYHYADMEHELSIELSYDEIKSTFTAFGLKLLQEKTNRQSGYTVDEKSMMRTYYYAVEFTCQKVGGDTTRGERAAHTKKKTRRGKGRKAREKEERRKVKLAEEASTSNSSSYASKPSNNLYMAEMMRE